MKCLLPLCAAALALPVLLAAETSLPREPLSLDSLAAFKPTGNNWVLASGIAGDPRRQTELMPLPGVGTAVNTAARGQGKPLITQWEHADMELHFEYLLPRGSRSGIYLMGRYEIALLATPHAGDIGTVHPRPPDQRNRGHEATAPSVNASRAPGLWQSLRIVFRAPRFDDQGQKVANARFLKVEHNGFVIHRNVDVSRPTPAARFGEEAATGPLLFQGDHGPVALRNLSRKLLDFSTRISLQDVRSQVWSDVDSSEDEAAEPVVVEKIDPASLGESNNFTAIFTGKFSVPTTGFYLFDATTKGATRLRVNGTDALIPIDPGVRSVPIELRAGTHSFVLDYSHGQWGKPELAIFGEGPGIARHRLETTEQQKLLNADATTHPTTVSDGEEPEPETRPRTPQRIIASPPADGVRVQRGFTPFDPLKRLYSIAVGSSTHVHYAYDFDTATVLRVWSGPFLDLDEFWDGRAHNQLIKPLGPALTLHDRPTIALLESGNHDWPNEPDAQWSSDGYTLNSRGQPTFRARLASLTIEDHVAPTSLPRGLNRQLILRGDHTSWMTGILLAEAATITAQPGGQGYVVGDREYYIDLPADNPHDPFVRHFNGRDQLLLFAPKSGDDIHLSYTLVW